MVLLINFPSQGLSPSSWGVSGARTSREGVCTCTAPTWAQLSLLRVSLLLQLCTGQADGAAPAPRYPVLTAPCKYAQPKHNPPLGRDSLSAHRWSHQSEDKKPWALRKRLNTSVKLTGRQTHQQGSRAILPAPAAGRATRGTCAGHRRAAGGGTAVATKEEKRGAESHRQHSTASAPGLHAASCAPCP